MASKKPNMQGAERGETRPVAAEIERRQRDEAASGGNSLIEYADDADRQIGAAEPGHEPA